MIIALKKSDADAFDKIFQIYGKRLYHFSLGYLKSKQEAEEIVQDVFLKIWNNRKNINPKLSFKAYLFKIAYRQIAEIFRKISRNKAYVHEILEESIPFNDELNEKTNYQSLLELVENVVEKLPTRQQEVFTFHKSEGLTVAETAEKLGIAVKTAEHHLTAAMKSIKSALEKENLRGMLFFYLYVGSDGKCC